jgi:DHA1 family bicyclomycin/chloramphenicol resistance-like MFS transporter
MSIGLFRSAAILGLLSAVGPFAIDMYLPALPNVADDLDTTIASVQLTLTAYFIAFGLAQLVYGPLADQIGRKPPLYIGLCIFLVGSLGCAFAPSIGALVAFRAVQGLGAAVVMVIPRAIIRDMHTGPDATRMMALIMLVISISPMLAPLAGSGVIYIADWRAIFALLGGAAILSLFMTGFMLPETLAKAHRVPVNLKNLAKGTKTLLRDRGFMMLTLIGGSGLASFFVFIASASFVYTGQFGMSPVQFSLAFAVNAVGFFAASQLAAPLGERLGMVRAISGAVSGFMVFSVLLAGLTLAGFGTLPVIIALLFLANACLGLVFPTTMVMALEDHGDIAGLASSLGGTLQMVAGGVAVMLAGPFFDGSATPMVIAIAICSIIAFILTRFVVARPVLATS